MLTFTLVSVLLVVLIGIGLVLKSCLFYTTNPYRLPDGNS